MAEILKEKWTQWAALTTTVFAVCASLAAARGGSMSTRTMVTTTKEANAWAYFQAKSIKQHVTQTQLEAFELTRAGTQDPADRDRFDQKIGTYQDEVARYDKEKSDIQKQAETFAGQAEVFKRHGGAFGSAVMLLQISIMMNSVGALLQRKPMWIAGIGFGAVGVFYLVEGFIL